MNPDVVMDITETAPPADVREEWRELAWRLPDTSFFQSPEWFEAWWDTIGGRPPTKVAIWRDNGRATAVAAMSRVAERLHRRVAVPLAFWTNAGSGLGAADHIGPLAEPEMGPHVARWIAELDGAVLLRNVQPDAARCLPEAAEHIGSTTCPRLTIPPGEEPIGRSTKFRKRLRRNSRILRERGVEFEAVDGPDITDDMIRRLMEMHEVRSDDQGWGSTFTPERIEFHRRLIGSSASGRGPGLMVARSEGEIVGVLYGFWWNGSYSYFQTGWDPAYWELSLGSALVYEMVLVARERGAGLFDFLRGPEEYKYRFGAEDQTDIDSLLARGAAGKALATKARLG